MVANVNISKTIYYLLYEKLRDESTAASDIAPDLVRFDSIFFQFPGLKLLMVAQPEMSVSTSACASCGISLLSVCLQSVRLETIVTTHLQRMGDTDLSTMCYRRHFFPSTRSTHEKLQCDHNLKARSQCRQRCQWIEAKKRKLEGGEVFSMDPALYRWQCWASNFKDPTSKDPTHVAHARNRPDSKVGRFLPLAGRWLLGTIPSTHAMSTKM